MTTAEDQAEPKAQDADKAVGSSPTAGSKRPWFGAHTGAPLAVLVLGTWLVVTAAIRFVGAEDSSCPSNPFPADFWLTGGFTMVLAAFLLGGLLGSLPHHQPKKHTVGVATQLGVTALVALIAAGLFYETRAVAAGSNSMLPITHWVMCIKQLENDWTVLVFILAALLTGRWLWHRPGTYLQ